MKESMMKKIRLFISEYYVVIALLLMSLYFSYHIFYSKRGYLTLEKINREIEQSVFINSEILAYKDTLTKRVMLLSGKEMDIDLVDEMVRLHLNMAEKDEYVILK